MTCRRCRINLPEHLTHDTPEECVSALRGRLDIKQSELHEAKRRADNLAARVDAWKIKAKTKAPSKDDPMSSRMDRVENRCKYSAEKIRDIEARLEKAEQRAAFAVNQVAFMQERKAS